MLGNSEKVGIEFVNATVVNENSGPIGEGGGGRRSPHYIYGVLKHKLSIILHQGSSVIAAGGSV